MSISQKIEKEIFEMSCGQIFSYSELAEYRKSPQAVKKIVSRLVTENKLTKFQKGKFYRAKKNVLGFDLKPSDSELIRRELYENRKLKGYITGMTLYNRLGLTTQVPRTVKIATNNSYSRPTNHGTISIRKVKVSAPILESNVKLLQYLDVLKDIKKILGSDINDSIFIMSRIINDLNKSNATKLAKLATKYYGPQVRSLLGLIFENTGSKDIESSLYENIARK